MHRIRTLAVRGNICPRAWTRVHNVRRIRFVLVEPLLLMKRLRKESNRAQPDIRQPPVRQVAVRTPLLFVGTMEMVAHIRQLAPMVVH